MNSKFTISYLRKYINQELTEIEMHKVEKASHEDEFLMDLIIGLEEEQKTGQQFNAVEIDSQIYSRTHPVNKLSYGYIKYLSLAASILIILGIGLFLYFKKDFKTNTISSNITVIPKREAATDTTLNSIKIEEPNKEKIEENLIAMSEQDDQIPQENLKKSSTLKENKKTEELKKNPTSLSKLSLNPNVFYKEIPNNLTINIDTTDDVPDQFQNTDNSIILIASNNKLNKLNLQSLNSKRVSSPQDEKSVATGRVLDLESGRPIINASIRNIKTNDVVVTDSFGQFIMPLTTDKQSLQALSIGYESQNFVSSNNKIVQLKSDYKNLGEAAGINSNKENFQIKSEPLIGWIAYKKYLNDHIEQTLLGKGEVTLIFDISTFGRPIDIQIKKSASNTLNQKAIQIIQNGPDWKKGNDGKKMEVKLSFK